MRKEGKSPRIPKGIGRREKEREAARLSGIVQCAGIGRRTVPSLLAASRQRIAVFCPIELNVKHGPYINLRPRG